MGGGRRLKIKNIKTDRVVSLPTDHDTYNSSNFTIKKLKLIVISKKRLNGSRNKYQNHVKKEII